MNKLTAKFLKARGLTADVLSDINDDDHALLEDIDILCKKLNEIHIAGDQIVILPDYDMDGISAGVLGYAGLVEMGFNAALFRPTPADGYGFTENTIKNLVKEFPSVKYILTCDVGIACYSGVQFAKSLGIGVLVTDHHPEEMVGSTRGKDTLGADLVVNPNRFDDSYSNKGICGAHVLYQVLERYAFLYQNSFIQEQISRLRVFAGIGTISDMMPLLYENRNLVRDALAICRLTWYNRDTLFVNNMAGTNIYVRAFYGLYLVLEKFAEMGKISVEKDIDESFFGFYLVPMFNSAKRLDADMNIVFGIFFGNTPSENVEMLYELNEQRKLVVDKEYDIIKDSLQPYAPYIYLTTASSGIKGLLAAKLMRETGLPTMVVGKEGNAFKGSGRSPSWYPARTRSIANGFYIAGHEGAFGVGLTDIREVKAYYHFLKKDTEDVFKTIDFDETHSDADIIISVTGENADTDIDIPAFYEFLRDLRRIGPFGIDFPKPRLEFHFKPCEGIWVLLKNGRHLKIQFPYGFSVLCWNQGYKLEDFKDAESVKVVGDLGLSRFNDAISVNFTGDLEEVFNE